MEFLNPDVIEDIKHGNCVLFLGPELLINKEGKYYRAFFKELAQNSNNVYKYFSRDNLFSISGELNTIQKRRLISQISDFYEEAGDDIVLDLISQMPFPLIINVAPDNGINKVFEQNKYVYTPAYFPNPTAANLPAPSKTNPVIYNIFGSIENPQSLIITHDDLFKTIKALMQKDSLPPSIYNSLRNAGSFIFLGIKFETWYYQLLLSILEIEKSSSLRIGAPDESDTDTVSIMNSYFQIVFAKSNPLKVVQEVYDVLSKDGSCLRKRTVSPPQTVAYISYAWKDDENQKREEFVDLIYTYLAQNSGVKIFRDRNVLTIQDSIDSFMNRIGRGKAVIMVVSDKYLKSIYCMYEAWQVYKNNNFNDRVFIAVLPDVDLSDTGINNYINYWVNKKNVVGSSIAENFKDDFVAIESLVQKNKNVFYIYLFMDQFLKIIKDTIHYQVPVVFNPIDQASNGEFENFTRKIIEKLNEQ